MVANVHVHPGKLITTETKKNIYRNVCEFTFKVYNVTDRNIYVYFVHLYLYNMISVK